MENESGYDDAMQAVIRRRKKAAELKRKRQRQLRARQKRASCLLLAIVAMIVLLAGIKWVVLKNNSNKQDVHTVYENEVHDTSDSILSDMDDPIDGPLYGAQGSEPLYKYPVKSNNYKEMDDADITTPYIALLDVQNNEFIAGRQYNIRIYPASMTKVMTLIVAVEQLGNYSQSYTFDYDLLNRLYLEDASVAGFAENEVVNVTDLLYGMILPSGAEAAIALSELVAGSEQEFAVLMNKKCSELGLFRTHFCNATGLHNEDQYTTPAEMAIIMKYAMENDVCAQVLSTYQYTTNSTAQHPEGILLTSTMFSRMYGTEVEGVVIKAGKTGYTDEAQNCLVSYALKEGKAYVAVTAASSYRWNTIFDDFKIYERYLP